jgi:predicted nucleic acid-binding protein
MFLDQAPIPSNTSKLPGFKIKDRSDLTVLSCALERKTDVFVTGDKELIHPRSVESLEILSNAK